MRSALVISSSSEVFQKIYSSFPKEYRVEHTADREEALKILARQRSDLIFVDLGLLISDAEHADTEDFRKALESFWNLYPSVAIVAMSSQDSIRQVVQAVKAGANDYLMYPIHTEEVKLIADNIHSTLLLHSELDYLRGKFWKTDALTFIKTRNEKMHRVFEKVRSVAPTRTTVLLIGETGTGKGVLAKLIHRHSNRDTAQFISVHCGAIPDTLLESELFGHEKGAFTGAVKRKLGKFEIAKNGTIFLDEIGTITPSAQIKLLQVLQDGTFSRVGGEEILETNARVVAATNADLKQMTQDGVFRKDLYYRFNIFPIEIPPLRERPEDIPYLCDAFIKRLKNELQKDINEIHPLVLEAMKHYEWPGNIRELENLIERAYILETSSVLTPEVFPPELLAHRDNPSPLTVDFLVPLGDARKQMVEDFEKRYLLELFSRNKGKVNISAREAGVSTRQLHKLMHKYGIHKEDFK